MDVMSRVSDQKRALEIGIWGARCWRFHNVHDRLCKHLDKYTKVCKYTVDKPYVHCVMTDALRTCVLIVM